MDTKKIANLLRQLADAFEGNPKPATSKPIGDKLVISGKLAYDAEVKLTSKGRPFTVFRLAVPEGEELLSCKIWAEENLQKGDEVVLAGQWEEYNGFKNFKCEVVRDRESNVNVSENETEQQSAEPEEDDDVPF